MEVNWLGIDRDTKETMLFGSVFAVYYHKLYTFLKQTQIAVVTVVALILVNILSCNKYVFCKTI